MAMFTLEQLYRRDKEGLQKAIQYLLEDIKDATRDISDSYVADGIKENCDEVNGILEWLMTK